MRGGGPPVVASTDVDALRRFAIWGEVERMSTSPRSMEERPLRHSAVVLPLRWTGTRGEPSTRPHVTKSSQEPGSFCKDLGDAVKRVVTGSRWGSRGRSTYSGSVSRVVLWAWASPGRYRRR